MTCDSAACVRFVNILKPNGSNRRPCFFNHFGRCRGVSNKYFVKVGRLKFVKHFFAVLCNALTHSATILFIRAHLAVFNHDARTKFKQVCAQELQTVASAALVKIVKPFDNETYLKFTYPVLNFFINLACDFAIFSKFTRVNCK